MLMTQLLNPNPSFEVRDLASPPESRMMEVYRGLYDYNRALGPIIL